MVNLLDKQLAELALEIPGATAVFHRYQMDFCCGGKKTLREAATKKLRDPEAIAAELFALSSLKEQVVDWKKMSNSQLIDHILFRFHDLHRKQLPELIRLANRVETVHRDHAECPHGLVNQLESMQHELEMHMRKEEDVLFPMLARGNIQLAEGPVSVMRHEHEGHGQELAELKRIAHNFEPPQGACNTWRALYLGLAELQEDLMEHIHLENNLLFERVDGLSQTAVEVVIPSRSTPVEKTQTCCGHCS